MTYRWYDLPKKEVLALLHTDDEKGLDRKEAAARLKEDGKNTVNPVVKAPLRGYLLQLISDLTALLLLGAALLAFLFRRDAGALVMLILLLVNYAVTIVSYIRAQKTLERLGYSALPTAKALRGGKVTVVDGESVVQGDILLLSAGDIVPADCRLLEAEDLYVLEGSLFGSERAVKKDASFERVGRLKSEDALNLLYASTVVLSGRCKAAVTETGPDTLVCRSGKNKPIAACHKLKVIEGLKTVGSLLGILLVLPVFFLTGAELLRGGAVIEIFLASLALAVSAMPELYTAFAYVAVARGMISALEDKKNKQKGVFIKNPLSLPAIRDLNCLLLPIESLFLENGSVLSEIFDGERMLDLKKEKPEESDLRVLRYGIVSTGLYTAALLNNLNHAGENVYTREQEALIAAGEKFGVYNKTLEERFRILDHRDAGEQGSLFETTLVHYRDQDVVVLRGSPRAILERCGSYVRRGMVRDMNALFRSELIGIAQSLVKENRMPVAVATKTSAYSSLLRIVDAQTDLVFEGFLSIEQPMLPGAAKQISRLRAAGIEVMAYSSTEGEEQRIRAKAFGIIRSEDEAVRAGDLVSMDEEVFRIRLKKYAFFEGFSAAQLRFTVETLREEYGKRIGMLGRKLGDVYPMYAVPVGISEEQGHKLGPVGKRGEEMHDPVFIRRSKELRDGGCQALNYVSDVILPPTGASGEGGVNAVSQAISAARFIYRNIALALAYLIFTMTARLTALLFSGGGRLVLSPVQILTLGLVFDLGAVFAICFDRPQGSLFLLRRSKTLLKTFLRLLPAAAIGALTSAASVILAGVLTSAGKLTPEEVCPFVFLSLLLSQFVCLTGLLRTGRRAGKDFSVSNAYAIYTAILLLFLLLLFLAAPFGRLFFGATPRFPALLPALAVPAVFAAAFAAARFLTEERQERGAKSEKSRKQKKKAKNGE